MRGSQRYPREFPDKVGKFAENFKLGSDKDVQLDPPGVWYCERAESGLEKGWWFEGEALDRVETDDREERPVMS